MNFFAPRAKFTVLHYSMILWQATMKNDLIPRNVYFKSLGETTARLLHKNTIVVTVWQFLLSQCEFNYFLSLLNP